MTIQDLLHAPQTDNIKFIGDESLLQHTISSVNIIDNPDVTRWFKKDEVVLTSGYFFYKNTDFALQVIHDLSDSGCAALGIKIKRYLEKIPDEIIEEAASCGLALLEIPYFYALSDVMDCIFSTLRGDAINDSLSEYKLLSALMSLLNESAGLSSMLTEISEFIGHPVIVMSNNYQPIAHAGFPEGFQIETISPIPWTHVTNTDTTSATIYKYDLFSINNTPEHVYTLLLSNGQSVFCIVSNDNALANTTIEVISHTLPILELELTEHSEMYPTKLLSKPSFLDVLAIEKKYTPSEFIRMCDYFGFSYAQSRVCAVLRLSEYENAAQRQNCMRLILKQLHILIRHQENCYLCESNEYLVLFFLYSNETIATQAVEKVKTQMQTWYHDILPFLPCSLHIAISSFSTDLLAIRKSYYDALKLLDLTRIPNMPHILVYQEQLPYFFLLEKTDQELSDLVQNTLGALVAYEKENPSMNLMETYKTYIQTHFNSSEAAKKLYIHRNTFLKRIEKIHSLISITSEEDRSFSILMGICAYEILVDRRQNISPIT